MTHPVPPAGASGGVCTFCGLPYQGRPNQCPRCGTLLNDAALDAKRLGAEARRRTRTRRASADLLFLIGLLLGGPMMTLGGDVRTGLFIVLAGAFASVLRRYTELSVPTTLLVGSAGASIAAAVVMEPVTAVDDALADSGAREAYAQALTDPEHDVFVEARGPGAVAVWFTVPAGASEECGDYPPPEVREHLAQLGFARVVVGRRNQSGGLCSFAP